MKLIFYILSTLFLSEARCSPLVTIKTPIIRGAIVDSYSKQVLIIRLASPSDLITDVIKRIDFEKMDRANELALRRMYGELETHYQASFRSMLRMYQEIITTPYPMRQDPTHNTILDLTSLNRSRRNLLLRFISFLRVVRPISSTVSKISKYRKFMNVLKYTGYASSTAVFAYELADIFGAIPDKRYIEVTRQLKELHEKRVEDLLIIGNISLFATTLSREVKEAAVELSYILSSAQDRSEIHIKSSQVLQSYTQQTATALMLALIGKIPSSLVSLDNQRAWLEQKLPSDLLQDISSITPHLETKIKNIDEDSYQVVFTVEIPNPEARFQPLNFVSWEPELIINGSCYTSPRRELYLAFPRSANKEIIRSPLLVDPDSCLTDGFLLCESDSILDQIPNLSLNNICTQNLKFEGRYKRATDFSMFDAAITPAYNLSSLITKTLSGKSGSNLPTIDAINELIDKRIKSAITQIEQSSSDLAKAETEDRNTRTVLIILLLILGALVGTAIPFIVWVRRVINDLKVTNTRLHLRNMSP
ncbi:MAG: hypothetical protein FZCXV1_gp3 [Hangzhou zicrona caerulea xinmovirus 1]|uniref:Uncharacterized protein n=1 Tax=Hangzhou zicrona caerulea xinmovirus 1 TaxID=2905557 RepID=A0A8K1XCF7_9MONO|nr:MAG: hypothetical protein FZCXV1_gp3 [Hangzhou zicrona caerulea xinmovirus 1]